MKNAYKYALQRFVWKCSITGAECEPHCHDCYVAHERNEEENLELMSQSKRDERPYPEQLEQWLEAHLRTHKSKEEKQ